MGLAKTHKREDMPWNGARISETHMLWGIFGPRKGMPMHVPMQATRQTSRQPRGGARGSRRCRPIGGGASDDMWGTSDVYP